MRTEIETIYVAETFKKGVGWLKLNEFGLTRLGILIIYLILESW